MSVVTLVARDELRMMVRNRVAMIGLALLMLLTLTAVLSAWMYQRGVSELRARHAHAAESAFDAQPDRHPHRMVHYGSFIFRPLGPLAAFDPGVDAFTGSSMFLEGHRQNTANFGDVRQSSPLIRFGQLTPAFILQAVAPLLLVFLGYGSLARETERGTLRVLILQGVARGKIVTGKLLALGLVALIAGMPAMIGLAAIAVQPDTPALPVLTIAAGYAAYLALWVVLIVLISAWVRRSRDALLVLVAIWAVSTILLPRAAAGLADAEIPLANRLQTDVAIGRDLRAIGDSHNPDDPHFAAFKRSVLDRYGVSRIEDLPINYKGVVALEGERLTSSLFDQYAAKSFAAQARQNAMVDLAGLLSPAIALRAMSMAAAGTDLDGHRRFLEQAEAYRYALVQRLNSMQAQDVSYFDDMATDPGADRRKRVSAANWQEIPDFRFAAPDGATLTAAALPSLIMVLVWLAVALAMLALVTRKLGVRR
ncbi:DUF3526 domain-containing protein [uncultured Novosphingobium sp.]|uniref:ABC transporter permease n=1 Tax=uncultured Novosphingobium sp. TaxID=292277 RepID=UPI00258FA29A|nr:DUF3526 domain-containing protein [uncultured Novosphingobium sp.]